jgi:hypothetical protein
MFVSPEAHRLSSQTRALACVRPAPQPVFLSIDPKGLTGFSRVTRKPLRAVTWGASCKPMNPCDFKLNRATTYATHARKSLRAVTYENRGGIRGTFLVTPCTGTPGLRSPSNLQPRTPRTRAILRGPSHLRQESPAPSHMARGQVVSKEVAYR